MSEILRFDTNVPVNVALKFPDGLPVEGRFGDQVMFTLTDDRKMYVAPIVAQKIKELGVQKGEPITICKREVKQGNRRGVEWIIERLKAEPSELETKLQNSIEAAKAQKETQQPAGRPAAATQTIQPRPNGTTSNGNVTTSANGSTGAQKAVHTVASAIMTGALVAAIDAIRSAEQYAQGKGIALSFNEEDIRALASTIYIQHHREASWQR